jgi:hypothetical protein
MPLEPVSGGHDAVIGYGLGLTEYTPPECPDLILYGHAGGLPGFHALVWHDPGKGTTIVLASTDTRIDFLPAALDMVRHVMKGAGPTEGR